MLIILVSIKKWMSSSEYTLQRFFYNMLGFTWLVHSSAILCVLLKPDSVIVQGSVRVEAGLEIYFQTMIMWPLHCLVRRGFSAPQNEHSDLGVVQMEG